jgi:hypothetical protein
MPNGEGLYEAERQAGKVGVRERKRERGNFCLHKDLHFDVTRVLFVIAKTWKQPK